MVPEDEWIDRQTGETLARILGGRIVPGHHIDSFWFPCIIHVHRGDRCIVVVMEARQTFTEFEAVTLGSVSTLIDWQARELGATARIVVITERADPDALRIAEKRGVAVFDTSYRAMNNPEWLVEVGL